MPNPHRRVRVESELQRAVSDLLRREVRDPRVGNVTITAVKVAPDLTSAKLYYALFGEGQDAESVQVGLNNAARFLRGQVGRRLKLRVAPELVFKPDEQIAEGVRMSSLIDSAVAADRRAQPDSADEAHSDPIQIDQIEIDESSDDPAP